MKAAILENQGLVTYQEVPAPVPKPGDVRLRVQSVSICGSDIKRYVSGHRLYPLILGHECAGIIDSVGDGVSDDLIGRHASVIPLVPCFQCTQCRRGLYSACPNYSFIGSREAGGFADYLVLPHRNAFIVSDALPFEHVALIEPSTVARHMLSLGGFQAGETALVFGAGSIGLMVVQWLRILGADLIISVDISDENLAIARELGSHVALNPLHTDIGAEVRKLVGNGVAITLEAAGVPQTLEQTIPVTRPRGRVILAGNQPLDKSLPLSFIENLMRRELSIIGSHMSYSAPFPGHEWTDTVEALLDGRLDMEPMISHRRSLAETPDIFAQIGARKLTHLKIMLFPEGIEQGDDHE